MGFDDFLDGIDTSTIDKTKYRKLSKEEMYNMYLNNELICNTCQRKTDRHYYIEISTGCVICGRCVPKK